jgi:L-malate glycosyltransferase
MVVDRSHRFRVALLTTSVDFGGIERVLLNLLQYMDPAVELVPIVFTRTDTRETSFFDRLRSLGIQHETLYVNSIRPYAVVNPLANLWQLLTLLRRQKIDLVHSHGYRADVFALAAGKWCRLPLVSTCHGFVGIDRRLRLYNALDTRVLRRFAQVIAVSDRMKDDLVAAGLDARKIQVITNAVPEMSEGELTPARQQARTRAGICEHEFVFGYVGRLSEEKGTQFLLDAAARLAATTDRFRIIVVGDGPERVRLEAMARGLGLSDRVIFAGFHSDTAPWYAAMDAFVLPSLTEGTPMALLEAMAHRLPVIASAVGGVPAMLSDSDNGLLVPPADVAALAMAMEKLTSTPSLRKTLAEGGVRAIRRHYDVASWIGRVRNVYVSTLQHAARQS